MIKAENPILMNSDVLGTPTPEMWDAMRNAKLGWAAKGGDQNVTALFARVAELTGKESALLIPSGTMANLVAMMTHTQSGDQVVLEANAHSVWSEEWGLAYVCRLFPRLVAGDSGMMQPQQVADAIDEALFNHKPKTSLVCLENTHMSSGGNCYTAQRTAEIARVAHDRGAAVHLDGARIFNASVALGEPVKELVAPVDSATINLNKALCAPEGAILCGTREFIQRARINLKRLGGDSMHKAGLVAAAGLVALSDKMIEGLAEDHRRARKFAQLISQIPGVSVDPERVQTNIVLADVSASGLDAETVLRGLAERNVGGYQKSKYVIRFCFYKDIRDEHVALAAEAMAEVLARK